MRCIKKALGGQRLQRSTLIYLHILKSYEASPTIVAHLKKLHTIMKFLRKKERQVGANRSEEKKKKNHGQVMSPQSNAGFT